MRSEWLAEATLTNSLPESGLARLLLTVTILFYTHSSYFSVFSFSFPFFCSTSLYHPLPICLLQLVLWFLASPTLPCTSQFPTPLFVLLLTGFQSLSFHTIRSGLKPRRHSYLF